MEDVIARWASCSVFPLQSRPGLLKSEQEACNCDDETLGVGKKRVD
jgi:hypothetical protein